MALTLPYPDMDFVPLDILTANELDQMVANIEFIANSFPIGSTEIASNAITTAKINNGAVTSQKIDFTTFSSSWTKCSFSSGYTGSNNAGFPNGIYAKIEGNLLFIYGGCSPVSGSFPTGDTIVATLPATIGGITTPTFSNNRNIIRQYASGTAGALFTAQIENRNIILNTLTQSVSWATFYMVVPLDFAL